MRGREDWLLHDGVALSFRAGRVRVALRAVFKSIRLANGPGRSTCTGYPRRLCRFGQTRHWLLSKSKDEKFHYSKSLEIVSIH